MAPRRLVGIFLAMGVLALVVGFAVEAVRRYIYFNGININLKAVVAIALGLGLASLVAIMIAAAIRQRRTR